MHGPFGNPRVVTKEIGGQFQPGRDKIVIRYFGVAAKARWPQNTAAHVAAICGCDERHAKRYISGEYPIPYILIRNMVDWMLGID